MPISQAILISSFPFEQRGRAMALFALAVMVSSIMGPTVEVLLLIIPVGNGFI